MLGIRDLSIHDFTIKHINKFILFGIKVTASYGLTRCYNFNWCFGTIYITLQQN